MKYLLLFLSVFVMACGASESTTDEKKDEPINTEKPVFVKGFQEVIAGGYAQLEPQQDICTQKYKLAQYTKFIYDTSTYSVFFLNGDTVKLEAKFQAVGSFYPDRKLWRWAWDFPNLDPEILQGANKVKQYGEKFDFEPLTKPVWEADELNGWEMTAVSSLINKSKGAYRFPTGNKFDFVIFTSLEWINARNESDAENPFESKEMRDEMR